MYWYVLPTLSWVCVVTMPELRAGALMSKLYFLFCWLGCTMARSSTGYGTRRAIEAGDTCTYSTAPEQPQITQIVQAGICSDCTFYAIWCWMCLAYMLHKVVVVAGCCRWQQRPALAGSPNITLLNRKTAGNSFYWNCSRCIMTIHQFNGGLWYLVYPANHSPKIPLFVNLMTRKH